MNRFYKVISKRKDQVYILDPDVKKEFYKTLSPK